MAERSLAVLGYRVRGRVVLKYVALLSLSLTVMAAVPALVAVAAGDFRFALRAGLVSLSFLAFGLAFGRIAAPGRIQPNEALSITALVFLLGGATMSWPMMEPGLDFIDALFESVSGVTTTGLSTAGAIERRSVSFVFCRSWLQWYGGLAIVVLALALVIGPGGAARRLAGDTDYENLASGTRIRARQLLAVYGGLTLCAVAVIWLAGASPFDAVIHGLSAISTGGFSSHGDSIAGFGVWTQGGILVFAFLGAVSFSLQYRAVRTGWRGLVFDRETQCLALMCVAVAVLLTATTVLAGEREIARAGARALTLAVSAQTTTGFSGVPVDRLDAGSKAVLIASMIVGGDGGATAGGIKIFRFLIVLRLLQMLFARTAVPSHAVLEPRVAGRPVTAEEIQIAVGFVLLYLTVAAVSWLAFLVAGHDALASLFEVVSALGTVGLSAGIATPGLDPALKLVLCLDMLMGRLEIVALLVLAYPSTWFGRRPAQK